jgi:Icc-related predicted phosphoesterase
MGGSGSKSLREFMDRVKPRLLLTGHIHEARTASFTGYTLLVNPGSFRSGYGALINLGLDKPGVELLKF